MMVKHSLRLFCGMAALAAGLAGCSAMEKVGAGAALPLAFAGDSAFAPIQMCGKFSSYLLARGDEVDNYTRQYWGGAVEQVHHDNPADLFYYIPGYCLAPFIPFASYEYYGMTTACMDTLEKKPYRRARTFYR